MVKILLILLNNIAKKLLIYNIKHQIIKKLIIILRIDILYKESKLIVKYKKYKTKIHLNLIKKKILK
jgi:hypothetical protein